MAQQARAVQTRQQIVVAAANLFSRVGFERARLNDIVGESGLTRGAIYFHFQSKDELAKIVVDQFQTTSIEAVAEIAATGQCAMCQIVMLNREMGRLLTADPVMRAGIRLTIELNSGEGRFPPTSRGSRRSTTWCRSVSTRATSARGSRPRTPRCS